MMIEIQPLQWAAFGGVLCAIGMLKDWSVIRALGIGAMVTGAASWGLRHDGPIFQLIMWVGFSFLSWKGGRRRELMEVSRRLGSKRYGVGLIGRIAEVSQAIENGKGKVRIGDQEWDARGPDAALGTQVKITGQIEGIVKVKPYEPMKPETSG